MVGEQVGERAAVGDDDALLVRIVAQGLLAVVEGVVGALLEGIARVVRKVFCRDDIAAEGIELTDAFKAYFFEAVPTNDAYYDSVRKVCEETGAAQCKP